MPKQLKGSQRNVRATRSGWLVGGTLIVAILGLSLWFLVSGNQTRLSDNGYEMSKSLYSACNLEDTKRLQALKVLLSETVLAPTEHNQIAEIVELAENGQWQTASGLARELLESQDTH